MEVPVESIVVDARQATDPSFSVELNFDASISSNRFVAICLFLFVLSDIIIPESFPPSRIPKFTSYGASSASSAKSSV